jgi:exopolyphosphatase/guanosine-5'-triphosphate,3'-diphosphate pyrophosphatase
MALDRMDRITVSKLAAVIRVANALDRLRFRRALCMEMRIDQNSFIIETSPDQDLSPIQQRVRDRSRLFAGVFGKQVQLSTRRT